ncbi:MAG: AMP-binding protein [Pseudomonadota bacterium]
MGSARRQVGIASAADGFAVEQSPVLRGTLGSEGVSVPPERPDDLDQFSRLLEVVRTLHLELNRDAARTGTVALDSALDRDLGFDSLARVELLLRLERAFGVSLPEALLEQAQTPRDLLVALQAAAPLQRDATQAGPHGLDPKAGLQGAAAAATSDVPDQAATLLDVLRWHVQRHPERTQIVLLTEEGEQRVSYADLWRGAQHTAQQLQAMGVRPRQTVAIMLPTCADYFTRYFGILLAGAIPVPIYPPARLSQIEDHVRRHAGILANAQAVALITVPEALPVAHLLEALVPGLHRVITEADQRPRPPALPVAVAADDIAFIQYTSGSTGDPKGVVLTHANLLANVRAIHAVLQLTPDDVFVSWLPLYHDMGLIGAWLSSLYTGNRLVVMSPLAFLRRPQSWLKAIHRFGGTHTAAPNFAYELCLRHVTDADITGLDLHTLRLAANGAEPVNPDTIARFSERFAPYGLRPEAMTPVYGLAENSVALLLSSLQHAPVIDTIDRAVFEQTHHAQPAAANDPHALHFVACGQAIPGHRVRLVDDLGEEVAERVEGRLEFQGPSATSGYYRRPDETRKLLHDGWLDSGDRAYRAGGEIYITGRVKDIIIRGGRNIYPHEVELAVGELPGVRKGCVVAFGVTDTARGTERLVVLAETRETDAAVRAHLHDAILRTVTEVLSEPPDEVVLAPPYTVRKTSSGKLRRAATRQVWASGGMGASAPAAWRQFARLVQSALAARLRHGAEHIVHGLYALWWWLVLGAMMLIVWPITALLPRPAWAWRFAHHATRLFLLLVGQRLQVQGREVLPQRPHMLLVNHSSDLDGLMLLAALRGPYRFIAKNELLSNPVARVFLRHLGAEFIERFDARGSVASAQRISALAAQGASLCIFPEGTFRRDPGLLGFHLGPFEAAVKADMPVLPVILRGTRTVLPDGAHLPHWHSVRLTIGAPLHPRLEAGTSAFDAAVQLRDAAHAAMQQALQASAEARRNSHSARPSLALRQRSPHT